MAVHSLNTSLLLKENIQSFCVISEELHGVGQKKTKNLWTILVKIMLSNQNSIFPLLFDLLIFDSFVPFFG